MVSGAVAGDDLQSVAGSASAALGRPVAIALPALGAPVVWPADAAGPEALGELVSYASAITNGAPLADAPGMLADSVPIRIGHEVVGIVAAFGDRPLGPEERAWLEGAAAAATVTALMRESQEGDLEESRRALLRALRTGRVADVATLVAHARRLGIDLDVGAVAICAQGPVEGPDEVPEFDSVLLASLGGGRVLGLVPVSGPGGSPDGGLDAVIASLRERGMEVAVSAPRRDPTAVNEALWEAELLAELAAAPEVLLGGQEETYRLLIGVLLRDSSELEQLRERTIAPLESYDGEHGTELLATLQAFLAHHGSTTETADAMSLHRHTVGYRLSRVHEVSGLSPYESDGRERLSLGLKAHQILEADKRRAERE